MFRLTISAIIRETSYIDISSVHRVYTQYRDITQDIKTGYHSQVSAHHKNWKWLRDRCLETDCIDFIPKLYVITYCILSYVILTIKLVTAAVTNGQLPFRDTLYAAYVYVR